MAQTNQAWREVMTPGVAGAALRDAVAQHRSDALVVGGERSLRAAGLVEQEAQQPGAETHVVHLGGRIKARLVHHRRQPLGRLRQQLPHANGPRPGHDVLAPPRFGVGEGLQQGGLDAELPRGSVQEAVRLDLLDVGDAEAGCRLGSGAGELATAAELPPAEDPPLLPGRRRRAPTRRWLGSDRSLRRASSDAETP